MNLGQKYTQKKRPSIIYLYDFFLSLNWESIHLITFMKPFYNKLTLLLGFMLCIIPLQAQKMKYTTLKPAEFKSKIEQTENPCVIDVRSYAADFEAGHITGAIHLDPTDIHFITEIKRRYSEIDAIFVYCKMGKTSKQAAQLLVSRGFQNVFNLKGGILAWEKKFPVVTE